MVVINLYKIDTWDTLSLEHGSLLIYKMVFDEKQVGLWLGGKGRGRG